jgi:hypothetical protein
MQEYRSVNYEAMKMIYSPFISTAFAKAFRLNRERCKLEFSLCGSREKQIAGAKRSGYLEFLLMVY